MKLEMKPVATKQLAPYISMIGARIVGVRYATPKEQREHGYAQAPVVVEFSNGAVLWPLSDPEGNDAGALAIQRGNLYDVIAPLYCE